MSEPVTEPNSGAGLGALAMVNPHRACAGIGRVWEEIPAADPRPLRGQPAGLEALDGVVVPGAGRMLDVPAYLAATSATSLVVLAGGEAVVEWYADSVTAADVFLGASMTKSALACLVGRAVARGALDLDGPVADLVPQLADSGYGACTVDDVLTMTSGVAWAEDHRNPDSVVSRLMGRFRGGEGGSRDLLAGIAAEDRPGTRWRYCTADSQVLDWVREAATGETFQAALGDLWGALGAERSAWVTLDAPAGVAMAGGGVAASARDWARIGVLQATGRAPHGGPELLPEAWRDDVGVPRYPFCAPGRLPSEITTFAGFGRHWWPIDDAGEVVLADGSRGQFTLVDRARDVVITQTSQWPYDDPFVDRQCRDLAYLFLPEIATGVAPR